MTVVPAAERPARAWIASPARLRAALAPIALIGLGAGAVLIFRGEPDLAFWVFTLATLPVLAALLVEIVVSLGRGEVGLDLIAGLSMSTALLFGEPLAGNVVALMYAGGQALEHFAEGRARRDMTALLGRVARTTMRYDDGRLEEVAIDAIEPGDRLLIRQGEVVPVDGTVAEGAAVLDLSALTGEAIPVERGQGAEVLSGATSAGPAFDLDVVRPAADSTYARIVRLVEAAQHSKAPMARLADRYAIVFLVFTVVVAGGAWFLTGDRLRALAVLVVATPCPLILAVPVAVISGMSRIARLGVLIKTGGALEALARVAVAVIDKTGTLTHGRATLLTVKAAPGFSADELLRLAASLEQASGHVVAAALVDAARSRGLVLSPPASVRETAGFGLEGEVDGRAVVVGGSSFVGERSLQGDPRAWRSGSPEGAVVVAVAVDGAVAGILVLADEIRADAPGVLRRLREAGIRRIVLASGDRLDVATAVGAKLGVDRILGELTPDAKVAAVIAERSHGPVMMVGDGVNDAPALAAASVGVALGARGAAASSEAADVVLLVDELGKLAEAIEAARRAYRIALQSVVVGLGLSVLAMGIAALGYLPPLAGALTQEVIDVAVILNALRALTGGRRARQP
ncbi:heavy metal translocating P-type ATPase [Chelatococcus asaccharovorans]|uniref:P-type Zn(2+) transporter n=1 Tax=Chelatococcus asaccharovorans TaxID=28210 RepID=A0A2V3TUP6_9HYPH|nr:heavy metal translocating P-type ATPase [Chelatococcus asaccharovorans]MBS7706096.1 cadmium-translocating P-type ATPase [Chelatococcus asaccharovorans]PXW52465.1 heavy metal-(Cd/Co/Hg/Pb/Zn)-translocating P-type ATPase [Chelatococcus asaccharovorans]